ncbi:JAB domain-containing protein [Phenylobacterium sp.]|uniref:JAB domain-containing protein n=1 Tax=Phenylobacterium sp. TaxID=1871053 RepID=UPI001216A4C1|nr:JAB domain-containing protein [Phenylobacterium sp.]THD67308.1 MAG: hypothetical protein E8A12_05180 [Phenylobacterium sp.]
MDVPLSVENAGAQPDLWLAPRRARKDRPYCLGRRDRLRGRVAAGGLAVLPDHELLGVYLFRAISRGDDKPLAKKLRARFGSLAAVLGATPEDPAPSAADIDMTRQIVEAGRPLRIAIHDHLIAARDGVAGLTALGLF